MNYDFLPLVEHSFTHGKEQILSNFIVSNKAKENLIYPVSFSLFAKQLLTILLKETIKIIMKLDMF